MIHYTQIIWEEVAFIWKVTGNAVADKKLSKKVL